MAYDILIKSGLMLDGVEDAINVADIGIKGDKIENIKPASEKEADANIVIEANGKYVTPGFIDITNHSDTHLTLFNYPQMESLIMQGVTSAIGGNCGASMAPLASDKALEAIKKWADPSETNIDWATIEEYLNTIDNIHPGINFGTFIGYGTLRRGIIGDEIRLLNQEELNKVKYLLAEGMKHGAFGLSLGLAYGHEKVSTTDEIIEICKAMQNTGGVIKMHLRSEGLQLLAAINEAIRIGRETGLSIQISHLKAIGRKSWPLAKKALDLINNSRASDLDINFDVSPYHTTGSSLYLLTPSWAREGGFAELFKRIRNPDDKKKIISDLKTYTLHYDKILITSAKIKTIVGHTVAELADLAHMMPEETLLETILANEGRVRIIGRTVSTKNTEIEISDADSIIATDGEGQSQEAVKQDDLSHPRCFGTFPHFWHKFVTDTLMLKPEQAIKKITSMPAKKLGIKNRGSIQKGNFADITIFDPKLFKDRSTYHNPFRYPAGIEYVIVNGKIAVEKGKNLGTRTGTALRFGKT